MEEKNFGWWIVFILLFIWQLPQAIVGVIFMLFLRNKLLIVDRHYNFCWMSSSMHGGISLGPFSYISRTSTYNEANISHEVDGHTVDSKIFGPLYLIIIGLPSLLNNIFDFTECEYDFYTERWANKHAGIGVTERCRLYFKDNK